MDLFGKKKDETKDEVTAPAAAKTTKKAAAKGAAVSVLSHVLLSPVVTEKAYILSEQGKYVFRVRTDANKQMIANAVAAVYGVTVADVHVMVKDSRDRTFRGTTGRTKRQKKAIVTLTKGQKIDLFA